MIQPQGRQSSESTHSRQCQLTCTQAALAGVLALGEAVLNNRKLHLILSVSGRGSTECCCALPPKPDTLLKCATRSASDAFCTAGSSWLQYSTSPSQLHPLPPDALDGHGLLVDAQDLGHHSSGLCEACEAPPVSCLLGPWRMPPRKGLGKSYLRSWTSLPNRLS